MIVRSFADRGYDAVLITEHDQGFDERRRMEHRDACRRASTERMLLVPGLEYSDHSNTIHLLVFGDVPFIGCGVQSEEVLNAAQQQGGVAIFAHPSRKNAWQLFNPAWNDKVVGIEAWNRKTDGWAPSKDAWSLLRMTGALPFVGMDFHDSRQFFPLTMLLDVESLIDETNIIDALKSKRCFSEAFGSSIMSFCDGPGIKTLHRIERLRRTAASMYRKVRG
ncbi:MAG: hypothetical protein QOH39_2170 [Verrucomicrobiota bacterium]|jgi:hypothetical protein